MGTRARGGGDNLRIIPVTDFSAGCNSMDGALSLGTNECLVAGSQNVIGFKGRALYTGGFLIVSTLPSTAVDNSWEFYDSLKTRHQMVWTNGSLYDCSGSAYILVSLNCYVPGENIGRVDQGGVLYWCSDTTPVSYYNGTAAAIIPGAPTGTYMTSFAGSLLVANPTLFPYTSTDYNPAAFIPSAVNDATTWLTADMQQVGTSFSGLVSFILPMGVTAAGVPPSKSMIVGMTAGNLFMYSGAIGSQNEAIINCPVGCLDANSAVYIPAPTLFGEIAFLGTDQQIWVCNGITAECLTLKNLDFVYKSVSGSRAANPNQKFFATYNNRYAYYLLDYGFNKQFLYRWQTKGLFLVNGWPSGAYFNGHAATGFAANFVAATSGTSAGLYQVGIDNATFNGVNPTISYQIAYLHGGNAEMNKEFQWATLFTRNLGLAYTVQATGMPRADNSIPTSNVLIFEDPAGPSQAEAAKWDTTGVWDSSLWQTDPLFDQYVPAVRHGMLSEPVPQSAWTPAGVSQPLRSGAISPIISWYDNGESAPGFDICGFQTRYNPRSMRTQGGNKYAAQSGTILTGADFFMGNQSE